MTTSAKKRTVIELSDDDNEAPIVKSPSAKSKSGRKNAPVISNSSSEAHESELAPAGAPDDIVDPTPPTKNLLTSVPPPAAASKGPPTTASLKAIWEKAAGRPTATTKMSPVKDTATSPVTPTKPIAPSKPVSAATSKLTTPPGKKAVHLVEDDLLDALGITTSPLFSNVPVSVSKRSSLSKEDVKLTKRIKRKKLDEPIDEIEEQDSESDQQKRAKKDDVEDIEEGEGQEKHDNGESDEEEDEKFAAEAPGSPIFEIDDDDKDEPVLSKHAKKPADAIDLIEDASDFDLESPKAKAKPMSDLSSWLKRPSSTNGSGAGLDSKLDDAPGEPFVLSNTHQVPPCINKRLRDYQREGVKFLYSLYKDDKGGILADDMGLGKTIQSIAFISAVAFREAPGGVWLAPKPGARSVLVVAPATVLEQWHAECSKWKLRANSTKIYRGPQRKSVLQLTKQGHPIIVITSYETMKNDIAELSQVDWEFIIMDEVHRIKGKDSKVREAASSFKTMRRYGLTGTLLQNNLDELWVLMDWCTAGRFCSFNQMRDGFILPIKNGQRQECTKRELALGRSASKKLKEKLSEFVLRRDKKIIADKLPSKEDRIVFCPLTELQMKVYKRILELPEIVALKESAQRCFCGSGKNRGECHGSQYAPDGVTLLKDLVLYIQTMLGKVCNHLQLMAPSSGKESKKQVESMKALTFMKRAFGDELMETYRKCIQDNEHTALSGKLCVLATLLPEWYKQGHKVLLFSKSTRMLDIIERLLRSLRHSYSRLDGTTPAQQRQRIVDEFNKSNYKTRFIFLLSTKAGGLGLNLVSANIVVVFDPNWNASHDLQAQDRAYRIGQTKDTKVFRFVATGTIEELMYQRQVYKQQLHNITIHGQYEKRWFKGVQGVKGEEGDLFGILNLLTLQEEKVITEEILKRADEMYKQFAIEDNAVADEEEANVETKSLIEGNFDDAEKLVKEVQEEEQRRLRLAMQGRDVTENLLRRAGVLYSHNNQALLGDSELERRLSSAAEREVAIEEAFKSQFVPEAKPNLRFPASQASSNYSYPVDDQAFPAAPNTPAFSAAQSWRSPQFSQQFRAQPPAYQQYPTNFLPPDYFSSPPQPTPQGSQATNRFKFHEFSAQQAAALYTVPSAPVRSPYVPPHVQRTPPQFDTLEDLERARRQLEERKQRLADAALPPHMRMGVQITRGSPAQSSKPSKGTIIDLSDS